MVLCAFLKYFSISKEAELLQETEAIGVGGKGIFKPLAKALK